MSFNDTLAQKDLITGETYQEYLQRNGMTIPEAQEQFERVRQLQEGNFMSQTNAPISSAVVLSLHL